MPPTSNDVHLISGSDLQRFASGLFQALGVAGPMADEWARSLVWANLRGVDSHGVRASSMSANLRRVGREIART